MNKKSQRKKRKRKEQKRKGKKTFKKVVNETEEKPNLICTDFAEAEMRVVAQLASGEEEVDDLELGRTGRSQYMTDEEFIDSLLLVHGSGRLKEN